MASVQDALELWRQRRRNVSEHKETNIEAWLVELQVILAEMGMSDVDLYEFVDGDPHAWVASEYEAFLEAPAGT